MCFFFINISLDRGENSVTAGRQLYEFQAEQRKRLIEGAKSSNDTGIFYNAIVPEVRHNRAPAKNIDIIQLKGGAA